MSADPHFRGGSGEPLVLLHGISNVWRVWEPVLDRLCEHHDVLAPTLAGHHLGVPFEDGVEPTISSLADMVERQMDEAGFERAHIAGNSLGGWLALELARRRRAHSVIAISPAGGWEGGSAMERRLKRLFTVSQRILERIEPLAPRLVTRPGLRRLLFRQMMEHGDRLTPDQGLLRIQGPLGCTAYWDLVRTIPRDGPAAGLEDVDAPVLLAWAEHDRILPVEGCSEGLVRQLPRADWRVLPGVGHVPMWDDPDLVARTIVEWAAAHPAGVSEGAGTAAGP